MSCGTSKISVSVNNPIRSADVQQERILSVSPENRTLVTSNPIRVACYIDEKDYLGGIGYMYITPTGSTPFFIVR